MPNVPPFKEYYPTIEMMDEEQLEFFQKLQRSLDGDVPIAVDGNISYLFTYTYPVLEQAPSDAFRRLMQLYEWYHSETHFSQYCAHWALDCLLITGDYERYLELTDWTDYETPYKGNGNLRVNLKEMVGIPIDPMDWFSCFSQRVPARLKKDAQLFASLFRQVVEEDEATNGTWLSRIKALPDMKKDYPEYVFGGVPSFNGGPTALPFQIACYYAAYDFVSHVESTMKEARNRTRTKLGLPKIGEGWVSETQLYYLLKAEFAHVPVIHHGRPNWLGRQHFDVWMPTYRVAVEYQGEQHYAPISRFGGDAAFAEIQERDERKRRAAAANGVLLIEVRFDEDFGEAVQRIRRMIHANKRI